MARKSNKPTSAKIHSPSPKEIADFKIEIQRELRELSKILREERVCIDTHPLDHFFCEDIDKGCRLGFSNLVFRLDPNNVKCTTIALDQLDCTLSALVGMACPSSDESSAFHCDPMLDLNIDIDLKGLSSCGKFLVHSWHLDRHPNFEGHESDSTPAHPRYHFHFGGKRVKEFISSNNILETGPIMLFDGPRLPHPPLDAILAVDMLLSNFDPKAWRRLKVRRDFMNLLKTAQDRFWRPYARSIAGRWSADQNNWWKADDAWPHVY